MQRTFRKRPASRWFWFPCRTQLARLPRAGRWGRTLLPGPEKTEAEKELDSSDVLPRNVFQTTSRGIGLLTSSWLLNWFGLPAHAVTKPALVHAGYSCGAV